MKRIFTLLGILMCLLFTTGIFAQTNYASLSSGTWSANPTSLWETFVPGPVGAQGTGTATTAVPSGSHNVYIRSPHIVTLNGSRNTFNVTIEAGATLRQGTTTAQNLRPGLGAGASTGNAAILTNNGTLGGATDGLFVEVPVGALSVTITGSGTTQIGRLRFVAGNLNTSSSLILDQDMTLTVNNYALSATSSALASTENNTVTINAGKTIIVNNGYWHNSGINAGAAPAGGNYTYNINGILDMSSTTSVSNNSFAGSTDATKAININLNGTLKLASSGASQLNFSETNSTGQLGAVNFNIGTSGVLEGYANNIVTSPTRYFKLTGNGKLKRTVGAADVLFAVGAGTSYNPVVINNTGTTTDFGVNVKNAFDVTAPAAARVDRQWDITASAGSVNAALTFSWTTADQVGGFNPAGSVSIYHYNGSTWDATTATVTGSGTTADPYLATASGFTSFSRYALGNASVVPVNFISSFASIFGNSAKVEWKTEQESGLNKFIIERSQDGINFTEIGYTVLNSSRKYTFYDASPSNGLNYYRIKTDEITGYSKYSDIMKIVFSGLKAELTVLSNPVKNSLLQLKLSGFEKTDYMLTMLTNTGQLVYSKKIKMQVSNIIESIALPKLSKGIYFIRLVNNTNSISQKIIIE